MKFLKYLICFFIISGSLVAEEGLNGWYSVEKKSVTSSEETEKKDASVWVLFSKNLGKEKISIRFPDDPVFQKTAIGTFEATAAAGGEVFQLTAKEASGIESRIQEIYLSGKVQAIARNGSSEADLVYQLGSKWVREHLIATPHFVFSFQTIGDTTNSVNHQIFVDSFSVQ